ncbi:peptidoglycan-binding protein [Taklimakanibacter lacteus]|uniref:peptidoglycan-binding protein n=1 Tax=Taklimakanibacter lacteus TaxID=2268456 RepID=UPI000E661268
MKPGIPWSVKGIDTEAREAAKHAARRSGMTLGEWLNTVIREQADEIEPHRPAARNDMHDIQSKLDLLSEQLTRMARQDTAAGRYYERSRPAQDNSLADILSRVEASERQTAENFARFGERLETLGDKIAKEIGHFPQEPEDVPGYRSLETAVRNIVDHIEVSERKTRDTLKAVQERLNDVAYAASAPIDSDRLLADAPVIARLESRIADLTGRVTGHDGQEDVRKLVQNEVGRLGTRIDQVKQASEASAQRAQGQAVQQMQQDLRDFEGRMQSLFRDADARRADSGEIGHLRAEMESLGQRVDDLKAEAASERDLRALRVAIEQLSARVAQGADVRSIADLDRRLTEISKWLEQSHGDNVGGQIAELERRVFDLDNRIAASMREDHAPAWAGIEREFAGVSDRLANTEQQLQHIATLEQSIHQLYQSMEQNRNWARDVAEDAANRMASRLMQDWSGKVPASGPSAELQALENALAAVRTNYENADQRNQETLGAVHETLEQIVNKLTELEQLREQPQAVVEEPQAFVAPAEESQPAAESQAWPDLKAEAGYADYQPIEPPVMQPEPAPVPASVQDEFIIAARRVAQAAAQQTPGPSAAGFLGRKKAADSAAPKGPSRFSLRFRRRDKAVEPASLTSAMPAAPAAPKAADAGKRRRLILIGLVLLAAASAFAYTYVKKPQRNVSMTPPPATEQVQPSAGGSSVFEKLNTTLAKTDAVLGNGIYTSSLPGGTRTASAFSVTDGEALPIGIGTQSLRQAALAGDAQAAFIVAARFAEGKAVPQDNAAAARWYTLAAGKGLAPAQYRMGALCERGIGTKLDLKAALDWYERAAAAGNVRAMHNAAVLLASGDKSKATYGRAAHWFAEAAAHNLKDSQFNMALLYERGLGVDQDLGQALFWYSLAARQNDADAAAKAKTLESTLPKDVAARVRSRLAGWTPKPDLDAANVVAIANPDWQERPVAAEAKSDLPVIGSAVAATDGTNGVQEAQELLNRLGFDAGEANGTMGSRTRNSIRLFELKSGMRITGEVTPELLTRLRAKAG